MRFLWAFLSFLWLILRTLLYDWIFKLGALALILWNWCKLCLARKHLPPRLGKTERGNCIKISDPAYKRPDPMIYDQQYLMAQGLAVTWDNPDIWIESGGVIVPPDQLQPSTIYDVVARIWNGSTEAPVVGLPVHFSYLSFGVGAQNHPVKPGPEDVTVNLGVKGGPDCPALATTKWKTPAVAGHYCLQVSFHWIDDANPYNNLGQDNTLVGVAHSSVAFDFQLRNDSRQTRAFRFETDSYAIPPLPACGQPQTPARPATLYQAPGTIALVPPQHDRSNYPLPEGWSVAFDPVEPVLHSGEEIKIQVTVDAPDAFHGRQAINVHAFTPDGLAGGVTFYVQR